MENNKLISLKSMFDNIMHKTDEGIEYWLARELQSLLGYTRWENFENAINKAKAACQNSNFTIDDHFRDVTKIVEAGISKKPVHDYMLTRYACYLIAQNGDSGKEEIAFAQSYFAIQTRRQELIEERMQYIQRAEARERLKISEKRLSQNIYERGVDDKGFARIRSKGDQALFGGKTTKDMKNKYGVNDNRPLADFLPAVTIAAKNLATEMTNYNVEQKNLQGETPITDEHVQNNTSVREMLSQRGIKPENLPASEDMKKLERKMKKINKTLAEDSRLNGKGKKNNENK